MRIIMLNARIWGRSEAQRNGGPSPAGANNMRLLHVLYRVTQNVSLWFSPEEFFQDNLT